MRLPWTIRLLGAAMRRLGRPASLATPAEAPARRASSRRLQATPFGRAVVRRRPRDVGVEESLVVTDAVPAGLPVRVYRPPTSDVPSPVMMNFHGGGFVQGSLDQSDWFCGEVARAAGVVVVSVDYRLAPEHPFPVPAEDCYAATAAIAAEPGRWAVDAERLGVMGDSAGGTLATVVCLMARDHRRAGRPAPTIRAQALVYPGAEMIDILPSERAIPIAPLLTAADIRGFSRLYLADGDGADPYASPLRADLTELPPALVQTAEHDPLRDHGELYAAALAEAGVPVRHTRYQGAAHGYVSTAGLTARVSQQAVWEVAHHLAGRTSDAPTPVI